MNIGIVTTWFERGAAYVSRQYKEVLEKENDVYIYARGGEKYALEDENWADKKVTWGKHSNLPVPTAIDLEDFKVWIKKNNIELVFFNEQHWWDPVLLCNDMGIITGAYIDYYTEQTVPFFQVYDFLICNTKRHYSVFKDHKQCHYLPWGTDVNLFKPSIDKEDPKYITFFHSAGYSPERKGTDFVIRAFYSLKNDDAKLVIHSQVDLYDKLPELKDMISELIFHKKLVLISESITAPGLYFMGDVYVYPSLLDGIGLTIAEALSCGLPVIVTDNAPMNEFTEHRINGSLVKVKEFISRYDGYYWPKAIIDIEDLSRQMKWYIDHVDQMNIFSFNSREYAEKNLNWNDNAKDISEKFNGFLKIKNDNYYEIENQIRNFENNRINAITKLKCKYPNFYNVIKFLYHKLQ